MPTPADIGGNAHNLSQVYAQLSQEKRADGQGSLYVFCAAKSRCGTSYVARNMAMIAQQSLPRGGQVLLIDMDIQNNAQSAYFFSPESQASYGAPTGPYDAGFGEMPFWKVTPAVVGVDGENVSSSHFMSLHAVTDPSIMFTHFHWEHFRQGQNVHIQNARNYWHKLRQHFAVIIVDTPAIDRSDILETICPEADANILVCANNDACSQSLTSVANRLQGMGARCAGVILNQAPLATGNYGGAI